MDGSVGVAGGDHDLILAVEGGQPLHIHLEETVHVGDELDFALLHGGGVHMLVLAQGLEPQGGLVLVEHAGLFFPHIEVLLAHTQQHWDILLSDHMALAEPGVLGNAPDDLRQVVAEHMAYRVAGIDQFHVMFLQTKKRYRLFTVPPSRGVQYPL